MDWKNKTCAYAVLGIEKGASAQEATAAFKKIARKHHPDLHGSKPQDEQKEHARILAEASEAHEVLSRPERKEFYDQYGWRAFVNSIDGEVPSGRGRGAGGMNMGDMAGAEKGKNIDTSKIGAVFGEADDDWMSSKGRKARDGRRKSRRAERFARSAGRSRRRGSRGGGDDDGPSDGPISGLFKRFGL